MSSENGGIWYGHTGPADPAEVDPEPAEADREQALRVRPWLYAAHEPPATPWARDEPFDDEEDGA